MDHFVMLVPSTSSISTYLGTRHRASGGCSMLAMMMDPNAYLRFAEPEKN